MSDVQVDRVQELIDHGETFEALSLSIRRMLLTTTWSDDDLRADALAKLACDMLAEPRKGKLLAATQWLSNAEMIHDLATTLGYLRDVRTLDPTWGRGNWWSLWCPTELVRHDRYKLDGVDFRHLPHGDGEFEQAAYDPPYVCPGGRKTSDNKEMHDRYGQESGGDETPDFSTPEELQQLMNDGLTEIYRVLRPGGRVVAKCKDYVWSGQLWLGSHWLEEHALRLGFRVFDRLEHLAGTGPQPKRLSVVDGQVVEGQQKHAARNFSTVFVLDKPRSAARQAALL